MKNKFFDRRTPKHWFTAKQKEDTLDAIARIDDLERASEDFIQPVGIINGAFDLLHASHLRLINEARWRAGTLVALIDSDRKIRQEKGEARPIMAWGERASSLFYAGADVIVEIDSDEDFMRTVEFVQPSFRVLGKEYKGRKSRLPHIRTIYTVERGPHTTELIERILSKYTPRNPPSPEGSIEER